MFGSFARLVMSSKRYGSHFSESISTPSLICLNLSSASGSTRLYYSLFTSIIFFGFSLKKPIDKHTLIIQTIMML